MPVHDPQPKFRFNGWVLPTGVLIALVTSSIAAGRLLYHAEDANIHEPPAVKEERIERHIDRAMRPIEQDIDEIKATLREIQRDMKRYHTTNGAAGGR